jgi:hypothetical protein
MKYKNGWKETIEDSTHRCENNFRKKKERENERNKMV